MDEETCIWTAPEQGGGEVRCDGQPHARGLCQAHYEATLKLIAEHPESVSWEKLEKLDPPLSLPPKKKRRNVRQTVRDTVFRRLEGTAKTKRTKHKGE